MDASEKVSACTTAYLVCTSSCVIVYLTLFSDGVDISVRASCLWNNTLTEVLNKVYEIAVKRWRLYLYTDSIVKIALSCVVPCAVYTVGDS